MGTIVRIAVVGYLITNDLLRLFGGYEIFFVGITRMFGASFNIFVESYLCAVD